MKTKKRNILQLIDSLATGGAEMMAVNIANGLAEDSNYNSHLVVTRKEGELKEKISKNVKYLYLNKKGTIDIKALIALKNYIVQNKIDVIHAHSSSFFYGAIIKMMKPNIKLIWHNHFGNNENLNLNSFYFKILKLFSKNFDLILNVNQKLQVWSKINLYCKNNVFFENFAELDYERKFTILKGENEKRIICLAGYRKEKNHLNLLQAFEKVIQKFPDWTLHLVGKGYEDNYHYQINEFVKQKHIVNNVYQYGVCSDIGNVLSQASIGVLSSDSEGLPVSLLEYGLAGLPVVVTNVGECSEVVEQGKCGVLIPPNDANALADQLLMLIENEAQRNTFGICFQKRVENFYSKEVLIQKLKTIY